MKRPVFQIRLFVVGLMSLLIFANCDKKVEAKSTAEKASIFLKNQWTQEALAQGLPKADLDKYIQVMEENIKGKDLDITMDSNGNVKSVNVK